MAARTASGSVVVPAPPSEVFALLADPRRHTEIDGSGTVQAIVDAPERLELGSTFSVAMQMGAKYRTTNRVVEFEPDRRIAWKHFAPHRWRYELEPVEGGTRVTETWDASRYNALTFLPVRALGFPAKAQAGIDGTLQRLRERFS
ncbi:SRPBCC family protein [Klenkia sp. PcliD-1-E]|uniref:SRPBCC family protein n=1 Tax=Klenkia sp. PcliD-1-E TaxID=2954492 RepID=UPI002096E877|nr:SRPBCC family protein [Klenkia sp. PcliD-1-E]MCO7218629.1 SRPBCC family protein [Klenkia sp. PcliD-1-E]